MLENWACKPSVQHIHRLLQQSQAIDEVKGYHCQLRLGVPPLEEQGWRGGHDPSLAMAASGTPSSLDPRTAQPISDHDQAAENKAWVAHEGGWALDVGVHAIRALRTWFGAIVATRAPPCKQPSGDRERSPAAETSHPRWSSRTESCLEHEGGVRGSVSFHFFEDQRDSSKKKEQKGRDKKKQEQQGDISAVAVHEDDSDSGSVEHGVVIHGARGRLIWNITDSSVTVFRNTPSDSGSDGSEWGKKGSRSRDVIGGDGWVLGGVQSGLEDALRQCGLVAGFPVRGDNSRLHVTSAEEAIRDACAAWVSSWAGLCVREHV